MRREPISTQVYEKRKGALEDHLYKKNIPNRLLISSNRARSLAGQFGADAVLQVFGERNIEVISDIEKDYPEHYALKLKNELSIKP